MSKPTRLQPPTIPPVPRRDGLAPVTQGPDGRAYYGYRHPKKGIYYWRLLRYPGQTKTAVEFYEQLHGKVVDAYDWRAVMRGITRATKLLHTLGVPMVHVSWRESDMDVDRIILAARKHHPHGLVLMFSDNEVYNLRQIGKLVILFTSELSRDHVPMIHAAFTQVFGKRYHWPGTNKRPIVIEAARQ